MLLADLLNERYTAEFDEPWEQEQMTIPAWVFAVHPHATECSLRKKQAILRSNGVGRSHQAI